MILLYTHCLNRTTYQWFIFLVLILMNMYNNIVKMRILYYIYIYCLNPKFSIIAIYNINIMLVRFGTVASSWDCQHGSENNPCTKANLLFFKIDIFYYCSSVWEWNSFAGRRVDQWQDKHYYFEYLEYSKVYHGV